MARTVQPTRTSAVLAALFAVLMLGLLGMQLALLAEQRRLIDDQRVMQKVLVERSLPVFDALRPLVEQTREELPSTRRRLREAAALVRETRPLVRETRPLVRETRPLVREMLPLLREATPLVREALPLVTQLRAATEGGRLTRALDASLAALAEARARNLLADADRAAESVPLLLGVQREALALLRESRDTQAQTLAIQREALGHIRSIDAKTGGRVPTASGPADPPRSVTRSRP